LCRGAYGCVYTTAALFYLDATALCRGRSRWLLGVARQKQT
jgi:hypothetical protein